jgi:eukaryotic-like serine/threonine-protein kinase
MGKASLELKSIFARAFAIDSPCARERYMAEACNGDATMRGQVESLLEAFAGAAVADESHVFSSLTTEECHTEMASSEVIDHYKLLEEIGEGGMGVVYMAEQTQPIRRRVALKIIKPGMNSRQVIARFEAERQALALMDHPNIAKVFDAGSTAKGRPYFVMELVKGIPITEFCDRLHLSPRERLELFVPVCQAIQHAHQKGIIHRDIKPSNVLVSLYDGKAVPKVIDFGVAKAIDQQLTERTLYTQFGAIVGTLEYMSPEQAENSSLDIDTRTDVYSLGVLLYELLTGSTPLERHRTRVAACSEVLRRIREEEPPSLSSRLSKTDGLAAIAANRDMEPAKLARLVRGELDWIANRALEKDRKERYQTANDLARDLERYLAGEPVEAGAPRANYRLRKFARQHRVAIATVWAFATILIAATAVSSWMAVRATREQRRAERAVVEANALLAFFQNKLLSAARPRGQERGLGYEITLREAIDAAESSIATGFAGQPTVEASIRSTLGATYLRLGDFELAARQHERAVALRSEALGPDHSDTLVAMDHLANAYRATGRALEAIPILEKVLPGCLKTLGPDHRHTLAATGDLALAYQSAGRITQAIPLFERAVGVAQKSLGTGDDQTLLAMNNLAIAYKQDGRVGEALPLYTRVLAARQAKLAPDHPDLLTSMNTLAALLQVTGKIPEAIELLQKVLTLRKEALGADHPRTLMSMGNLAVAYSDSGRTDEALDLYREVLASRRVKLSPGHPATLKAMNNLSAVYLKAKKPTDAEPLLRECLELRRKSKLDAWLKFHTMSQLGAALAGQAKYAEAQPFLLDGYAGLVENEAAIPAARKKEVAYAAARIISLYESWGRPSEAAHWQKKLSPPPPGDENEPEP